MQSSASDYVKEQTKAGFSKTKIAKALKNKGYTKAQIKQAFEQANIPYRVTHISALVIYIAIAICLLPLAYLQAIGAIDSSQFESILTPFTDTPTCMERRTLADGLCDSLATDNPSHCDNILQDFQPRCHDMFHMFYSINNEYSCHKIKSTVFKRTCLALTSNNPMYCSLILPRANRLYCNALANSDVSYCDSFPEYYKALTMSKFECESQVRLVAALKANNPMICEAATFDPVRMVCVGSFEDTQFCNDQKFIWCHGAK